MNDTNLEAFRKGFCAKAAELGFTPSELLEVKQADGGIPILGSIAGGAKDLAGFLVDHGPAAIGALTLAGAGGGALANYFYNKAKFELDPEDTILPDYGPLDEAKQLHLLAKYRNAKRMVKSDLS